MRRQEKKRKKYIYRNMRKIVVIATVTKKSQQAIP